MTNVKKFATFCLDIPMRRSVYCLYVAANFGNTHTDSIKHQQQNQEPKGNRTDTNRKELLEVKNTIEKSITDSAKYHPNKQADIRLLQLKKKDTQPIPSIYL